MKKIITAVFVLIALLQAASAQKIENKNTRKFKVAEMAPIPFQTKSLHKGGNFVSDWYSVFDLVESSAIQNGLKDYIDFLVWDSLTKNIQEDGSIYYGAWNSAGHIYDPHDDGIQLTKLPDNQLSVFNSYKLDTIAFRYIYVRNVDSLAIGGGAFKKVVDTLFVTYFKGTELTKGNIVNANNEKQLLALPNWNYSSRIPANYIHIDTILMAKGANGILDTTRAVNNAGFENSWTIKLAQFAVPAGVEIIANSNGSTKDNLVGFSFTFKSGIQTVIGTDTAIMISSVDPATLPAGARRTNYFGFRYAQNEGSTPWDNQKFYNTTILAPKTDAYKDNGNGWNGYVSGNAYSQELFLEAFFHLTVTGTIGVGINELNPIKINSIYPNPTKNMANLSFALAQESTVKIGISNMIGQQINEVNLGKVQANSYALPIDLTNLNPGIYFVTIFAGNNTQTQKIVISE